MTEVVLTRVFRKAKETKYGIKQQLSIQTEQHGDKWLSTFATAGTEDWAEGDTVKINVIENGDFLNFKPMGVSSKGGSEGGNSNVESRLTRLEKAVFGSEDNGTAEPVIEAGDDEEVDDGGF